MLLRTSVLLIVSCYAMPAAASSSTRVDRFGTTVDGRPVARVTLTNDSGMRVAAISYGATITTIAVPDRDGQRRNVVLSLPDMASYARTQRRWASVIGRYAGRIDRASVDIDGRTYRLEPGRNGVTLHGGTNGYDKRVWRVRTASDSRSRSAIFTLVSPDGDQGFPGRLAIEARYRLMRRSNVLNIEYRATTNAPTVLNLTNHMFLNLHGAGIGSIRDQMLTLLPDRYAQTDGRKIPTGRLLPVAGTALDFRRPTAIGANAALNDDLIAPSHGFDQSYVLADTPSDTPRPVATVSDPASGRTLAIATTEPGVQFNDGNGFDGSEIGSEGVAYPVYAGLALETQHLPDSPHRPGFASTVLRPGDIFRSITVYRFGTDGPRAR